MSAISQVLYDILHARFGKDVRQAIHDGIELGYDIASDARATAETAQDSASASATAAANSASAAQTAANNASISAGLAEQYKNEAFHTTPAGYEAFVGEVNSSLDYCISNGVPNLLDYDSHNTISGVQYTFDSDLGDITLKKLSTGSNQVVFRIPVQYKAGDYVTMSYDSIELSNNTRLDDWKLYLMVEEPESFMGLIDKNVTSKKVTARIPTSSFGYLAIIVRMSQGGTATTDDILTIHGLRLEHGNVQHDYMPFTKNNYFLVKDMYKIGTWTPKLYDGDTYVRDLPQQRYYKIGNLIIAQLMSGGSGNGFDFSGISAMLQIRNLPMKNVLTGSAYLPFSDYTAGANEVVQANYNFNALYLRPNIKSSQFTNASDAQYVTICIIGTEM